MRTTRAQAIASRCIVAKVPVEVLTQILQYANIKPSDLASVAATCRYLRAIASPLLLQRIFFSANNKLSFAPLEALVGNAQKGALVRKLTIKEGKTSIPSNRAPIYSNLLSRALDVLLHLEMITIPFALLDQAVFTSIYNTPSITTLEILPAQLAQKAPTLQLSSRNAFPAPRPSPLIVPKLASQLSGNQSSAFCTAFLSDLLEFLTFHSISVEKIRFSYLHTKSSLGNFLTAHAFDALREVDITFLPAAFDRCTNWLTQVLAAQTSLETVTYNVMNAWDGFELGRGSWVGWANGALIFPVAALADAWRGVMVKRLMMRFTRTPGDDDPIASDVEIVVPTTTTLLPSQTRAISTNEPCIFTLSFAAEEGRLSKGIPTISWEDWVSLIQLRLLSSVVHRSSLTPHLSCFPSSRPSTSPSSPPTNSSELSSSPAPSLPPQPSPPPSPAPPRATLPSSKPTLTCTQPPSSWEGTRTSGSCRSSSTSNAFELSLERSRITCWMCFGTCLGRRE
ncbi:hypothetical protein BDY24DRAFT_377117 [Mrakia frigida]|uniref:F-box protein n=1 Tax=Mrakia frigida TaxID=29902 RepID=UPI003FCC1BB2